MPAGRAVSFLLAALTGAALLSPPARSAPVDDGSVVLLLSLDRPAGTDLLATLRHQASEVWAAEHLPVAAVEVGPGQAGRLRSLPGVLGVYPNRRLPLLEGSAAVPARPTAAAPPDVGVTGRGVTVAVVDTGVDGTHPDLGPALVANLKFPPQLRRRPLEGLVNTDTTSGHGTHVAGDALGRGLASDGRYRGMAPGASLVGLATGEGLSIDTSSVVRAYDWVLENRDRYGIRVVNNSFGTNAFEPFDPTDPVNRATKAAFEHGVVVVVAAGNSGDELTMNTYATPPWVIAVGAGGNDGGITEFSSGGLDADVLGEDSSDRVVEGETRRPLAMGLYHPSVLAPGENVVGPRAPATVVPLTGVRRDAALPPGDQARYTVASGTSMAAPEAAGAVALVLEANPALRPADVRRVLQVTARPLPDVAFFRQGYGHLDPAAAVALARRLAASSPEDVDRLLSEQQAARDEQVLASLPRPLRTLTRTDDHPSAGDWSQSVAVDPGTARIKVATTGPGVPEVILPTLTVVVRDAAGREVGRTALRLDHASEATILDLDLTGGPEPAWGRWTVEISNGSLPPLTAVPAYYTVIATFAAPGRPAHLRALPN